MFKQKPTVAFRRIKSIRNHVVRSDITRTCNKKPQNTSRCEHCKICPNIDTCTTITNSQNDIKFNIKDGGSCKTTGVIYAATCTKHNLIYIGHTGEKLSDRFSKHRYDIKQRPDNSELAAHFHQDHDISSDMRIQILQSGIRSLPEREFYEDKWICRLQTLQPTGMNMETHHYAREVYQCHKKRT